MNHTFTKGAVAKISVNHITKKYGYPPDKQEKATIIVLEQTKLLVE